MEKFAVDSINGVAVDEKMYEGPPIYAEYAVKPVPNMPNRPPIYAEYAVKPVPGGPDVNITYSQLEENINALNKTIDTMKNSWNLETKKNINTLDNSWIGPECEEYTNKLMSMDKKVQNTISALELLRDSYIKARDMLKDSQSQVMTAINSIDG